MAQELGMGVTPWSPLRFGVLSGKYSRTNTSAKRGEWVTGSLDERAFQVVDRLRTFADELGTTPAHLALAWVQSRPGVTSTIIGARTCEQLASNLEALTLTIPPAIDIQLEELTKPTLNFPSVFLQRAPTFARPPTTLNGVTHPDNPLAPRSQSEPTARGGVTI